MKKQKIAPILTKELKKQLVHRIEPYLQSGLSINKACLQAEIPRSTLYKIMEEDKSLRDRVDRSKEFFSIATSNIFAKKLHSILLKQQAGQDIVGSDLRFIKWLALNSVQCKDEFGRASRMQPTYDPEIEIKRLNKIIDENAVEVEYEAVS